MVPVVPCLFSGSLTGAGDAEAGAGCLPVQPAHLVMTGSQPRLKFSKWHRCFPKALYLYEAEEKQMLNLAAL